MTETPKTPRRSGGRLAVLAMVVAILAGIAAILTDVVTLGDRFLTAGLPGAPVAEEPKPDPAVAGEAAPETPSQVAQRDATPTASPADPDLPPAFGRETLVVRDGAEIAACGTLPVRVLAQPPARVVLQRIDGGGEVELGLRRPAVGIFGLCRARLTELDRPLHGRALRAVISFH